jgi:hypothetical protein
VCASSTRTHVTGIRREGSEVSEQTVVLADADPAGVWAAAIGTAGVFVLLIVLVWQIAATWRARMLAAREEQYKELARKYAELLEDNVELHRRSIEELTTARRSIGSLEQRLTEQRPVEQRSPERELTDRAHPDRTYVDREPAVRRAAREFE